MNQLFFFRDLAHVPSLFSGSRFSSRSVDQTFLAYVSEKYGERVIIGFPAGMIEEALFVKRMYPFSVPMGVVDDIGGFSRDTVRRLSGFDYMVLVTRDIDELVGNRGLLRGISLLPPGTRRYVVLSIGDGVQGDDIALFIDMSTIYGYSPVLHVCRSELLDDVVSRLGVYGASYCRTRWFNKNIYIYTGPHAPGQPLIVMTPCRDTVLDLIVFRDCYAFLCHGENEPPLSAIIRFIYENTRPVLRLGGIIIDEEFIAIADALGRHGSIRSTSRDLGLPYTKARRIIMDLKSLEKILGVKLLEVKRGGADRGKTSYTRIGEIVLDNLKNLYTELVKEYTRITEKIGLEKHGDTREQICIFPLTITPRTTGTKKH